MTPRLRGRRVSGQGGHHGQCSGAAGAAGNIGSNGFRDSLRTASGGLGGLGLSAAELLAERGARHLVLLSRRPPEPATRQILQRLQQAGTTVITHEVDISRQEEIAPLLGNFGTLWPPLRGVLHTAAVVVDGVIAEQSAAKFKEAMAAKVHGAWNLHLLTQSQPLDFFVGYSSIASLFGGPGQSSYAAGNAFVDALAHLRRQRREPRRASIPKAPRARR